MVNDRPNERAGATNNFWHHKDTAPLASSFPPSRCLCRYPMTQPLKYPAINDPRRLISRIAAGETKMCGRDEELAKLDDIVNTAIKQKPNHVIVVPGVSGAGKSKVVDTFGSSVVQDTNVLFCTGKCHSTMTNKPFTVVKNALSEMAVTILAGNNEDDIRKTDALRRTDPRLSQCVSWY